eukprot:TRINITY_DN25482_c0_g1_i1.p1 TRINITY_DN25482_c0_g1~~TRINITY_DN25482_c0_g1_i1.p1  ORF type:complete len:388 (-),score=132.85 TRINITY_DN25482_c0_g1_i1:153-1316(-)
MAEEADRSALSDAARVAELLPDFDQHSGCLAESGELWEELRLRLEEARIQACERRVELESQVAEARKRVSEAEREKADACEGEKAAAAAMSEKAEMLADAQVELKNVEVEHNAAKEDGRSFAAEGDELRCTKAQAEEILEGPFRQLVDATWESSKCKKSAVLAVGSFLQGIGAEKTLFAAVAGALGKAPDQRGEFDKIAVDAVSQALSANLLRIEKRLAERAPAEREARAEMLGLWALMDICCEKADALEKEHKALQEALKAAKAKSASTRKEAAKRSSDLDPLLHASQVQTNKEKAAIDALAAFDRLVESSVHQRSLAAHVVEPRTDAVEASDIGTAEAAFGDEHDALDAPVSKKARLHDDLESSSGIGLDEAVQLPSPARASVSS